MTDKELKDKMNTLFTELEKSENKRDDKIIIAKAVQLGITYQTEKIKEGINIVFNEL